MIRHAVIDGADAVELFEEEEVGEVVGGGHGGEGEAEVGHRLETFGEAVGAAEDDGDVDSLDFVGFKDFCERFGGECGADGVENYYCIAFGDRLFYVGGEFEGFGCQKDEFFQSDVEIFADAVERSFGEGADGDEGEFEHKG